MSLEIVALVAAALLALAVALQIGLALGAPWGAAAYGGRAVLNYGVLPVAYRCASGVAMLTLLGAMWVVLASASLVARGPLPGSVLTIMLWCLTGMLVLNTVGNARGSHPVERWGPAPSRAAGCPLRSPGRDVIQRRQGPPSALERLLPYLHHSLEASGVG